MLCGDIQQQLQLPYARARWLQLLRAVLPGTGEFAQPQPIEVDHNLARQVRHLGRVRLNGGRQLAILEIEVGERIDVVRNRVGLRDFVARFIDQERAHGVLAIFLSHEPDFRFTFVAKESILTEDGMLVTKETATRRFTYVLGPNEPCRTPAQRFAALAAKGQDATLGDVTEAFSVEKLNREFFDTYKAHYQKFCSHLLDGDAPTKVFGIKLKSLDDKARDLALKPVRDFVKKLLGRLVFLHFLQKKGWLGCPANANNWKNGEPDFLRQLFDTAPAADQQRFHSRRLVPLFFDTLNRQRKGDVFTITGTRVPYLNGGLFERDFENVGQIDFPAELFRDLLEFFGQYNFTIDENDPDDHEIGIDPEMLGHIFENLLEDNKDKGAFYTPKAIVQYMCQQSLIYYLKQHLGDRPEIETLVRRKDVGDPQVKDNWIRQNAKQIEKLLDAVKICDPAIGSGAFPIGLLQEIYWLKLSLDWTLDRAKAKRDIIQHSIYGVDIDAGAVEIARLRFWLALVVEENTPRPLPNLDYKIMQGNSLLESFEGIDLSNLTGKKRQTVQLLGTEQTELGFKAVSTELTVEFAEGKQQEIGKLIHDYFDQDDHEQKQQLHRQIDELVLGHIEYNLDLHEERTQAVLDNARKELKRKQAAARGYQPTKKEAARIAELEAQLAEVDRKRDELAKLQEKPERPFFLWHLFFQDVFAKGGFDVAIANPPYIPIETIPPAQRIAFQEQYPELSRKFDSSAVFILRTLNLIKDSGVVTFISSVTWQTGENYAALRKTMFTRAGVQELINLPFDVFAEAYVDTGIYILRGRPTKEYRVSILPKKAAIGNLDQSKFSTVPVSFIEAPDFKVAINPAATALLRKMKALPGAKTLGDVTESTQGLAGSFFTRVQTPISPDHLLFAPSANVQRYFLDLCETGFADMSEHSNLTRFYDARPKILIRRIINRQDRLVATLTEQAVVFKKDINPFVVVEKGLDARYLLALVNSRLFSWVYVNTSSIATKDDFRQTTLAELRQLPIRQLDLSVPSKRKLHSSIIEVVDGLLAAKKKDAFASTSGLERELDRLVYDVYELTEDDVRLLEDDAAGQKQDFDSKALLFNRVLPELKAASPYFTTDAIARRVQELGLEIKLGTLPVYLSEATANGLIQDAGRGWYSRLSERVPLDARPVAKLMRAVEKAFPLLDFTLWSTAQINPWMHHLLAQPVAFLHADPDTLESVGDTLRSQGWEVAVNPTPSAGPKSVRPGEKMVVLRPAMSKQPPGDGRQATIEKILVDLIAEAPRLALMDASEAQGVATAILNQFLVQLAVVQRYADSRAITVAAVEAINQRQSVASIGVA